MKFKTIERLPKKERKNVDLFQFLEDFMSTGKKFAELDFDSTEYASLDAAQGSLSASIARFKFPIVTRRINKKLYLIRTDK